MTRGKKLVVLVGSKKALGIAVRNRELQKRFTQLVARLRGKQDGCLIRAPAWRAPPLMQRGRLESGVGPLYALPLVR
ncbi:hypothetical protein [Hyalangium sp.]|uniref:hypothetical protein n=1 Tax=Hyalangium sp. TaxID=2028555 RepID=UPI002D6DF389|nr:hypothetical protein [Hyalangium sp.]HYI01989.1 hypothetical protein [Hyalangium sp.]